VLRGRVGQQLLNAGTVRIRHYSHVSHAAPDDFP
jgi:hypothetical protein